MYFDNNDQLVFSPSDLIRFMESPFASWMERLRLERPGTVERDEPSEELKLVAKTGDAHEADYLSSLKDEERDVCEIPDNREEAAELTRAAIAEGREIIFQGYLTLSPFAGYTDFLVRAGEGHAGQPIYEVWDTKLARKTKPYYLIQLCCYAEMLEEVQGVLPEFVRVVLGTREVKGYRTDDYRFYYQKLKEVFLRQMEQFDPDVDPPAPDSRADHGLWQSHADRWLVERDHLVQVAGISVSQIRKLEAEGVATVAGLATSGGRTIPKLSTDVFGHLVEQAALQIETREAQSAAPEGEIVRPSFRIIEPAETALSSGLAMVPPPSSGDVYFDIEGFPLEDQGLEYLLGAVTVNEAGEPEFHDWWAHDEMEERRSFEAFIDWVHARWRDDPSMHIYHYAPYEVSAMRRLMGRYGTREEQVDELLRGEVFVDLYQAVRQGLMLGDVNYSLKSVEKLYRESREGDVKNAAASMVFYAWWIESGQPRDWRQSEILKDIRDYNEDDCVSTWQLAGWLRDRQGEHGIEYRSPIDNESDGEPDRPVLNEGAVQRHELAEKILSTLPETLEERDAEPDRWHVPEMLGHLLEFHRREAKPVWWAMFDRHSKTAEELAEDLDCLGDLRAEGGEPETIARSLGFWYSFDPDQDTKLREEKRAILAHDLSVKVTIEQFESGEGRIQLKISKAALNKHLDGEMPDRLSLIPDDFVSPKEIEESIQRLVESWDQDGSLPEAFRRFLLRLPPQIEGREAGAPLLDEGEDALAGCIRIASGMSGSTLCIQGPPGAGKTYTASRMITHLLAEGKNIGIASNSHAAVLNVMKACHEAAGGSLTSIKAGGDADDPVFEEFPDIRHIKGSQPAIDAYSGGLIGGTAWLFSRPDMVERLDYLFVDEAGQVSVANLDGTCASTDNIVLVGDQMQLGQPIQGAHPGQSGQSLLEYLLGDHAVVPPSLGVFLSQTWRMHPGVCDFISDAVYEGRLHAHPSTANRMIIPPGGSLVPAEAGVLFSPVPHHSNTQSSDEEVDRICAITEELLQREHTDRDGNNLGRLTMADILFVAPYNMQVRRLRDRLPDGARVGSVDKFQGQEAPVVIVSMCSSAGDFGSRGIGFVLDRTRINVAVSRAQSLAVVVGDPDIAHTAVGSVADMERVNLFCRIVRDGES